VCPGIDRAGIEFTEPLRHGQQLLHCGVGAWPCLGEGSGGFLVAGKVRQSRAAFLLDGLHHGSGWADPILHRSGPLSAVVTAIDQKSGDADTGDQQGQARDERDHQYPATDTEPCSEHRLNLDDAADADQQWVPLSQRRCDVG